MLAEAADADAPHDSLVRPGLPLSSQLGLDDGMGPRGLCPPDVGHFRPSASSLFFFGHGLFSLLRVGGVVGVASRSSSVLVMSLPLLLCFPFCQSVRATSGSLVGREGAGESHDWGEQKGYQ